MINDFDAESDPQFSAAMTTLVANCLYFIRPVSSHNI